MHSDLGEEMTEPIVRVEGLNKHFGSTQALRDLRFDVAPGTVCGLLGPNGAGKTTAVRVLATLLRPDSGTALIAGHDVVRDPMAVRKRIGLAGQHAALDETLTGRENLRIFGRLYHLSARSARARADELLERFDLATAGDRQVKGYSGGMRRRLDLIASLIVAPDVLFLDEPTTGLDPRSRNEVWEAVRGLVTDGTTVLLTTQYLDEADQLANNIVVIDTGTAVADDTPGNLKATIGAHLDVTVEHVDQLATVARELRTLTGAEPEVVADERRVTSVLDTKTVPLPKVTLMLHESGVAISDLALRHPTLDEVFLRLTGEQKPLAHNEIEMTEDRT
ncbi:ATP-binding cassette domain-containing protein [Sciscionella marina]|uniref:ATP-binding cassette domain-containing protein n=1 Tax=Sciscionella marina TaxID=508770 RepID=UPI0003A4CC7F|nr:ATP-binding cassette domain-containing protein [Sciscionella marina]